MKRDPKLREPVIVDAVLDDPELIWRLAEANGPYSHVLKLPEFAAVTSGGKEGGGGMGQVGIMVDGELITAPIFRGNWAYDRPLVDGVEPILHNERLAEAARTLFGGAEVVRPEIVYINLTAPMPANRKHIDVPAFRGVDRTRYPSWIVWAMLVSGLFDPWRVKLATAVAWYYDGVAGGFSYWPDGGDAEAVSIEPPSNMAVVGDNEYMFHRVDAVGEPSKYVGVPLDAQLESIGEGRWRITKDDRVWGPYERDEIRISVSWKAQVFETAEEARVYDEHLDDLTFEQVVQAWRTDLAQRGIELPDCSDPLQDPAFEQVINEAYMEGKTTA
jgi:hypothetical protein